MARVVVARGGWHFATPIVLASGPAGFGLELAPSLDLRAIGALTTKTITIEPRAGNPQPRIVATPSGILNSIGLQNPGLESFRREVLPRVRGLPTVRIVSLAGRSPAEAGEIAAALDGESGVDWLELNLSCPNVHGGTVAGAPREVGAYVRAIRRAARQPVLAKLPSTEQLVEMGGAALDAGAEGLTLVNAVPGMRIDVETGRPFLARECGGLCGPAILPIALARVFEVRRAFPSAFFVGTGGVVDVRGVVEMLCAGANLVGVGFGVMADPAGVFRLAGELDQWLDARGIGDVSQLVGTATQGGWRVP